MAIRKTLPYLVLTFALLLLAFPRIVMKSTSETLILFSNNVLPALFPFLISVSMLSGLGSLKLTDLLLRPLTKLLYLPAECASALILGCISGYPVGAKIVQSMRHCMSRKQAECALLLCNLPSPMFIAGTIGLSMFSSWRVVPPMLIAQVVSALLTAYLFRDKRAVNKASPLQKADRRLALIFTESFSQSIDALLRVLAVMVFFGVIISIISSTDLIKILPGYFAAPLLGLLEMTAGAKLCSELGVLPGAPLCSFLTVFGGCSVLVQTLTFVDFGTSYILKRALQGLIAAMLTLLFILI